MADTSDFRNGLAFNMDGEIVQIIEFQHVKPGKGGAFVRTKLKRLRTGATVDKTFRSGEKIDPVFLERVEYQYLYRQGEELVLMDLDSFEQINVPEAVIGDGTEFLKEEMKVLALVANDDVLGYEIPNFVELEIAQTDPGFKGDTVSGSSTKPATLETGAVIQVPYHIKEGDVVKVDTRSGAYLERVKR
ncbi:MAG: elongation factor P [Fimbriimonadaceae bacterium]|nr:elongation factor P [Fimbriimonadaceae bacterium]